MTWPRLLAQVVWVIRKNLMIERRSGETFWMVTPFAALALMLAPLAVSTDTALLRRIGPGMLWLILLLFGLGVALRPASRESQSVRDLAALGGLDPAARFLGDSLGSAILLVAMTLILTPVMIVLYAPEGSPAWGRLILLAGAGAVSLGLLGSLIGAVVTGLRTRTPLAPLLALPPSVPVLVATTRGTESALSHRSSISWVLLLVAMDLALVVVGVLLAGVLDNTPTD